MKAISKVNFPVKILLTIAVLLFVSSSSCGILDECDATLASLYYVDIRAEITVTNPAGALLPDVPVRVEIQKIYCGGKEGPNLVSQGVTASTGVYTTAGSWSLKMSNEEDVIIIRSGLNSVTEFASYRYEALSAYADRTFVFTKTIIKP